MTRSVQDFVEKIARSTVMRSLPTGFSRTTCLCARPSRPGSDAVERIVQSACAVAARARKKKAHLKRMSHMSQTGQRLFAELRILSPSRLYQRISAAAPENADRSVTDPKRDLFSGLPPSQHSAGLTIRPRFRSRDRCRQEWCKLPLPQL